MNAPGLHPALEPAPTLDWPRVDEFLNLHLPEDERLDYKDRVGSSVMETAAAMANTRGGTIVVGVRENPLQPNTPGTWDGVSGDPQGALNNVNWSYCTPAVRMQLFPVQNPTTGNTVLVVAVEQSLQAPVWHRDKGNLVRVGDQDRLASPSQLEAWYAARVSGHPSENALRSRRSGAAQYGAPGFSMHVWPFGVVPASRFGPETDADLDRLASALLPAGRWEGHPSGGEYVLQADSDDRHSIAAVAEQGYVRFLQIAVRQPPASSVDFVTTLLDLINHFGRRLVFAELSLGFACAAPPPFRVELLINYGSNWRVAPPGPSQEYRDPSIPGNPSVETPAVVTTTLYGGMAADATAELLSGTLRRLGWRNFDSVLRYETSELGAAIDRLYAAA